MKRLLFVTAAMVVGCQHARKPEREEAPPPQAEEKSGASSQRPERRPEQRPPPEEGRPQLSPDAEGLLQPGGARLIQEALAKRGYLPREHQTGELDLQTAEALRRFQSDERAPRTGFPDRETVRRLGLEVGKVFIKATGAPDSGPDR